MARLEIRRKPECVDKLDGALWTARAYDFLVDGRQINHLTSISLVFDVGDVPRATVTFLVDELEIDAEALTMLQAIVEQKDKEPA